METIDIPIEYEEIGEGGEEDYQEDEVTLKLDISYNKDGILMQEPPQNLRLIILPDPSQSQSTSSGEIEVDRKTQASHERTELQVISPELMVGPQMKIYPGRGTGKEVIPISDPFKLELIPLPQISALDEKAWYHYLGVYRSNSKIYLERYLYLLSNEPPIHKALVHENWRYRKQDTITQINDLESWFVDVDEPFPRDDRSETYHLRTDAWRDRLLTKLRKHITDYCPPQIVCLIEKSTSYKIRHNRQMRMRICLEQHTHLNQSID